MEFSFGDFSNAPEEVMKLLEKPIYDQRFARHSAKRTAVEFQEGEWQVPAKVARPQQVEQPDDGRVRIDAVQATVIVRPSSCIFHLREQLTGGRRETLTGGGPDKTKGKNKKKSLRSSITILNSLINDGNIKNLSSHGPYGEACDLLKMKNTKPNRKRLQTYFARNKLSDMACEKGQLNKLQISQPVNLIEKPRRTIKPARKFSDTFYKKENNNTDETYCVCNATNKNWEEGGAMAKCDACNQWYHYKCICGPKLKLNKNFVSGKNVKFICGMENCKYKQGMLSVKGALYKLLKSTSFNQRTKIVSDNANNELKTTAENSQTLCKNENDPTDNISNDNTLLLNKETILMNTELNKSQNSASENIELLSSENLISSPPTSVKGSYKVLVNKEHSNGPNISLNIQDSINELDFCTSGCLEKDSVDKFSKEKPHTNMLDVSNLSNVFKSSHYNNSDIKSLSKIWDDIKNIKLNVDQFNYKNGDACVENEYLKLDGLLDKNLDMLDSFHFKKDEVGHKLKKQMVELILSLCDLLAEKKNKEEYKSSEINDDCESKSDSSLFSKNTMSSVLGIEIPERFFTYELPSSVSCSFNPDVWNKLVLEKNKRCFKRNSWQDYFINCLKESNPYCVFNFDYHRVSVANIRKKRVDGPIFIAAGHCKFIDCQCKFSLKMFKEDLVQIHYSSNVKHDIKEKHSRHISGKGRENLKNKFKLGVKPLAMYLDKFNECTPEQLISGNRDGIGNNSKVFAQIASESRQVGREDADLIKSLITLKDQMNKEITGGFIQKISVYPMYILYWSDHGLEIFNDRANKSSLFWDATGSVVRNNDDGKRYLYYEMAINNPVKGKMGIPVTSMISENQSLPVILDWLQSFRHAQKKKFGHSRSLIYPKTIVSDQSMVFILAALKEFNNENLEQYLHRTFKIAEGKASLTEMKKTVLHLCTSHFMKTVKRFLSQKDVSNKKIPFFLYTIGLLIHCSSLNDLKELLFDIFIAVGSKYLSVKSSFYVERLLSKINKFDTSAIDLSITTFDFENELGHEMTVNPNAFTEEDYQLLGSVSPFKELSRKVYSISEKHFLNQEIEDASCNKWFCEIFLKYLIDRILPIFPLWSSIVQENINKVLESHQFPRTNSLIENRFRILKEIYLNRRSKHRLDEFSEVLKKHTISIQKLAVMDSLKPCKIQRKRKLICNDTLKTVSLKVKRKSTLVEEQWNKKNVQSSNLENQSKIGKYQQAPKKEIKLETSTSSLFSAKQLVDIETNSKRLKSYQFQPEVETNIQTVCKLANFGTTCWFNSVIQAMLVSKLSKKNDKLYGK